MKVLLLLCCCFVSAFSHGQISIVNLTDHDSTSKTLVTNRPYLLRINNVPAGAQLKMSPGGCQSMGDHVYRIGVSSCTTSGVSKAVLLIYNSHHDLLFSQSFSLIYQPDTSVFKATMANSCDYEATVAQLCADPCLRLLPSQYKVISFSLSIMKARSGDLIGPFTFNGDKVLNNEAAKCWFEAFDLKPGNRIFVDEIKVQCTGCHNILNINPIVIHIK